MSNDIMAALMAANEQYETADVPGYSVHPNGKFIANVDEAVLEMHPTKGYVQLVLKLVTDEGSLRHWQQLSNFSSEKQVGFCKKVLLSLGFEGDLKELAEQTTGVILGNQVEIDVKTEVYDGNERNSIWFNRFVGKGEFAESEFGGQFSAVTLKDDDDFPEGF